MAQTLVNTRSLPRKRRLPRPTPGRIALFLCVAAVSVALTVFGTAEFIGQVSIVRGLKHGLITVILQAGLLVLGPVVLWAYLTLIPKGLLTSIFQRLSGRRLRGSPQARPGG